MLNNLLWGLIYCMFGFRRLGCYGMYPRLYSEHELTNYADRSNGMDLCKELSATYCFIIAYYPYDYHLISSLC